MTRPIHRLTSIDTVIQEATCVVCGHVSISKNGHNIHGEQQWKCGRSLSSQEHRLLDLDWDDRTAWCKACQRRVDFIGTGAARLKCGPDSRRRAEDRRKTKGDQIKKTHADWRSANAVKLKDQHYQRMFGIPFERVRDKFSDQGGTCAICTNPISLIRDTPRSIRASLDHDHETGAVRDLLCHHCNTGLGAFQDSSEMLDAAANYLRRHRGSV